jgi:protein-disulfide isomerase
MRTATTKEAAIRRFGTTLWICVYSAASLVPLLPSAGFSQTADDRSTVDKRVAAPGSSQGEPQKKSTAEIRSSDDSPSPSLSTQDMPSRGEATAKVALVEYFDYQCPYCAAFFDDSMPQLLTEYIATGEIKFVVRDFPLDPSHPLAFRAAEAARCANDQGKFWSMHDELMGNSDLLDRQNLSVFAQEIGLDVAAFDKCLDSRKHATDIKANEEEGRRLRLKGTPTFFLGVVGTDGTSLTSVQRFDGAVEYPKLKSAIDRLLAAQK